MAKIKFERSGGVVGQNINLDLDLDSLPASESQHLLHLIQESDFFNLPENLVATSTPDEFKYAIEVEAGAARHSIHTSDTGAPESLRPLLRELSALAMVI